MDWTGNVRNMTTSTNTTIGVSKKNDSKFLVIDQENSDQEKILYTEYTVSSDSTGKIVMNENPVIQRIRLIEADLDLTNIGIISLNDVWIVSLGDLGSTSNFIVIISAETKKSNSTCISYTWDFN